jgi:hypothetical protein
LKARTLFIAAACLAASATTLAATCPSVHVPAGPAFCDLYLGQPATLAAGQSISKRILLPLNTTIDDKSLPVYAVDFATSLAGGFDAGALRVSLSLSDDTGGHVVPLGRSEFAVPTGVDKPSVAVSGKRFGQPAHLNVTIERLDDGAAPLDISHLRVIQSFESDVDGVPLTLLDKRVLDVPNNLRWP